MPSMVLHRVVRAKSLHLTNIGRYELLARIPRQYAYIYILEKKHSFYLMWWEKYKEKTWWLIRLYTTALCGYIQRTVCLRQPSVIVDKPISVYTLLSSTNRSSYIPHSVVVHKRTTYKYVLIGRGFVYDNTMWVYTTNGLSTTTIWTQLHKHMLQITSC